jgi:uncharacterized membrane protein (DUF106 family)
MKDLQNKLKKCQDRREDLYKAEEEMIRKYDQKMEEIQRKASESRQQIHKEAGTEIFIFTVFIVICFCIVMGIIIHGKLQ